MFLNSKVKTGYNHLLVYDVWLADATQVILTSVMYLLCCVTDRFLWLTIIFMLNISYMYTKLYGQSLNWLFNYTKKKEEFSRVSTSVNDSSFIDKNHTVASKWFSLCWMRIRYWVLELINIKTLWTYEFCVKCQMKDHTKHFLYNSGIREHLLYAFSAAGILHTSSHNSHASLCLDDCNLLSL